MDNARRYIHAESSSSACNRVDSVDTRSKRTQLIEPISHIYIYIYKRSVIVWLREAQTGVTTKGERNMLIRKYG